MPHVVTEACVNHKYQDCVSVCPVDAFREKPTYLVIVSDHLTEWIDRNEEESVDAEMAEGDSPVLGA